MSAAAITVKLFGPLRRKDGSDQTVIITEGETIRAAIERLSIDAQPWYLYSVNGMHAGTDACLHAGDVLMIIPPVGGG